MPSAQAGGEQARAYPKGQWETAAPGAARVLFLNLMPEKERTERDFVRTLAAADTDVVLIPLRIPGQKYAHTPQEYVERHYVSTDEVAEGRFDGLIITGAPLEQIRFEDVRYWRQLCALAAWADTHAGSTLYICWGAQAGLYCHYGIEKRPLAGKLFGVFPQKTLRSAHPLMRGLGETFPMPHSRHTGLDDADILRRPELTPLAGGEESGLSVAVDEAHRRVFVTGHLEYAADTLHREYVRDLGKGLPISAPRHYYKDGAEEGGPDYRWEHAARAFYANWLRYCCAAAGKLFGEKAQ